MGLEGQLYLSGKGLLDIQELIPPNYVFACKIHKYIMTTGNSQTKGNLRNVEWDPTLR